MTTLRLLSVNTKVPSFDRPGLARLIADRSPDLACVHGAPSLARWRSMSAALARQSGLVVVVGGRTSGGNLLLSSLGVDVLATRELSFAGTYGVRRPGAALAALRLLGHDFTFVGARLGRADAQREELTAASAAVVPDDLPLIVSVDGPGTQGLDDLVAVGGGLFVDDRVTVGSVDQVQFGTTELTLTL